MARNKKNQEIALKILKVVGIGVLFTAVSVLSPTFPYVLLRAYLKRKFGTSYNNQQLRSSVAYLKKKQFIACKNKKYILTKLGKKYLKHRQVMDQPKIARVSWDGKWRVVSFDIPQSLVSQRHILRKELKDLGFFHFQRSVFVIPYPCEKEIDRLTEELGVEEYVHILTAQRFRNDRQILKKYHL